MQTVPETKPTRKANGASAPTTPRKKRVQTSPAAQFAANEAVRVDPTIITSNTKADATRALITIVGAPVSDYVVQQIADFHRLEFSRKKPADDHGPATLNRNLLRFLAVAHRDLMIALGQPVPEFVTMLVHNRSFADVEAAYRLYLNGEPKQEEMFDDD